MLIQWYDPGMSKRADRSWNRQNGRDSASIAANTSAWDYIVVGSGMGGMTAAAFLSKLGRRVLVLEQHYIPGGFTHTFKRKGWEWDVGVHAVGEVSEHSMPGRLLAKLTDGRLKWSKLGGVYDEFHWPDDLRIDFPDTPTQFRTNLLEAFPDEEEAIDGYLAEVKRVAKAMRPYYLARAAPRALGPVADRLIAREARECFSKTTREVIESLTDNVQLRAVFAAQWGYYGSTPSRSSFAIQALVVKHFQWGAYYPVGGSGSMAKELLATVAATGGWTRICADVEEILVEKGRACGVRLVGGEEIRGRAVVSAAGVQSTLTRLLPRELRDRPWAKTASALRPASAHVCLYLGFEGDIREAGAGAANKWFYDTWDMEEDVWAVDERCGDPGHAVPPAAVLYCSFPSLKDPDHEPGERVRHTGEVVTFVPWDLFARWQGAKWRKRGSEYDALKKALEEALLEQFLSRMPGLRDKVKYVELSTPVSTDHFCRPMAGSIYGIEPTVERFENPDLRPNSRVKGLYFAGSEVATVGVMGAMMGGVLATAAAEPLRAFKYLKALG